ncbi:MAG: hypothetical protein QW404_00495 [Candidatus Nanoarchaeia archaeon]
MALEDDVYMIEAGETKDAHVFYRVTEGIFNIMGFKLVSMNYYVSSNVAISVRHDKRGFEKVITRPAKIKGIRLVKVFIRPDMVNAKVLTSYENMEKFNNHIFSYYVIGVNSKLNSDMEAKVRDRVIDANKTSIAAEDFRHGYITKVGSHYFFTLEHLFRLSQTQKPFLRPFYQFEC